MARSHTHNTNRWPPKLAHGEIEHEPLRILSLAARRKGIARFAALHLDCARSAEGGAYRFALEKQLRL
jgi:hypothetical protein